jgi:cyclin H
MTDSKPLTEDDIYRASTQYKFWSFTADSLASLRASTNSLAAARVRDAMRRAKSSGGASGPADSVECLTVDEEQKLVGFYCEQAMKLADFCEFPTNIKVRLGSRRRRLPTLTLCL